jgi:hypothetical protein
MVNWNTVCAPKEHGGLGVWDPEKINIALGEKLLWRLITDGNDWWKKAIFHKYLSRNRRRCLDIDPDHQSGSPIWKLIRSSLPILRIIFPGVPGNGREINLWEDCFSASRILKDISFLDPVRTWLTNQGKFPFLTSQNGIVMDLGRGGTWEKSLLISLKLLIHFSCLSMGHSCSSSSTGQQGLGHFWLFSKGRI